MAAFDNFVAKHVKMKSTETASYGPISFRSMFFLNHPNSLTREQVDRIFDAWKTTRCISNHYLFISQLQFLKSSDRI